MSAPTQRPRLTLTAAAEATGVSRSTIRRLRESGQLPNSTRENGAWVVPVTDLLAAGLTLTHRGEERTTTNGAPDEQTLADRVRELETALAVERAHRAAAEQVALAHQARAEDLRVALRAIESARPTPQPWWRRPRRTPTP